jgi:hypothetical protein
MSWGEEYFRTPGVDRMSVADKATLQQAIKGREARRDELNRTLAGYDRRIAALESASKPTGHPVEGAGEARDAGD